MSTNSNLITLLEKASTINFEVTNSTNFIFTQPLKQEAIDEEKWAAIAQQERRNRHC